MEKKVSPEIQANNELFSAAYNGDEQGFKKILSNKKININLSYKNNQAIIAGIEVIDNFILKKCL